MTDPSPTITTTTTPSLPSDPLTEEGGRTLVADWQRSGLSCTAYCMQRGLRIQRLFYWRQRLGLVSKKSSAPPPTHNAGSSPEGFVEIVPAAARPDGAIEVVGPGGVVVRLPSTCPPEALRRVVEALQPR